MKKRDVLNLIRYYTEHNDAAFRNEAYGIAKDFDRSGDTELAEYVLALLSDNNTFVPQSSQAVHSEFLHKELVSQPSLPLPEQIMKDLQGVLNAIGHNAGVNRFLFYGPAGTGKTESVKQLSAILRRELYTVDFSVLIDSKLGQTSKNIANLFAEMNSFTHPEQVVVLFDEIDALAMDRIDSHDVREMGRATSALLKGLDSLSDGRLVLFATTNLFDRFDKALVRRFDAMVNFGKYSQKDLAEVASSLMNGYAEQFSFVNRDMRLFNKVIGLMEKIPYPGELKNMIRSSIAFSSPGDGSDYLRRLYVAAIPDGERKIKDISLLDAQGFTLREIEILSGVSKSTASRELKGKSHE
ncbi:ATP-binding protein [Bifidobacterium sp. ESL0732]|uniref:ATP-binding protein n=1 Tax=Bifidobacterium sp. ESL0732 TaxID=2983222 RepID=UPI0023FA0922|nr:ATP-binding protein [Bifidobacterium sp. ESL0732]WEV63883.1 ATP-binding protein [Bifidobacterium sp. ESL0732]